MRVLVAGVSGRMGRELTSLLQDHPDHDCVAGVGRHRDLGGWIPVHSQFEDLSAADIDVVIDFSLPELAGELCEWCHKHEKPLVSGTTGLSDFKPFERLAAVAPVLWAPNMSLGVAWLNEWLKAFKSLEDFDFQIEEFHHRDKKDRPSGTAKLLQDSLSSVLQRPLPEVNVVRGGGIYGIHKVYAMSPEEMITVEHRALNRRVFARGALRAAEWLHGRAPGRYQLKDVLS